MRDWTQIKANSPIFLCLLLTPAVELAAWCFITNYLHYKPSAQLFLEENYLIFPESLILIRGFPSCLWQSQNQAFHMVLSRKKILHCSHLHVGAGQELLAQSSSDQSQALLHCSALSFHFFPISLLFFPCSGDSPWPFNACKFSFLGAALLQMWAANISPGAGLHLQRTILTWARMDRYPKPDNQNK